MDVPENQRKKYWRDVDELVSLVGRARETEILMRVVSDAGYRAEILGRTVFAQFDEQILEETLEQAFKRRSLTFEELIDAVFDQELAYEMHGIRRVAGALAHAKCAKARELVDAHLKRYSTVAKPNTDAFPGILLKNVLDEDGGTKRVAHLPETSRQNTAMLEWEIFRHAGYDKICLELFEHAQSIVREKFDAAPGAEWGVRTMEAIKLGNHFPER